MFRRSDEPPPFLSPPPAYSKQEPHADETAQDNPWVNAPTIGAYPDEEANRRPASTRPQSFNNDQRSESCAHTSPSTNPSSVTPGRAISNTGKLYHVYHDSGLDTSQLKVLDQAKQPIWRVTTNALGTMLKLKSAGSHKATLGAARFHTFSSDIEFCLGDPDVGQTSFFDVITKDPAFMHYRHRWGMNVSDIPGELVQRYAASVDEQNKLRFMWRRPGDKMWEDRDWEMIIDNGDGSAKNVVVLARFQAAKRSWKKKGRLYMDEGWGERWELMTAITAFAVLEKERVRHHR